ncbi:MAG: 50S ribosome-binding GTPase, partial [Bdellovibrionales bacterium]|nr:50S ribosome-binding GTPase [Bdellovibrionales bacterium]
MESLSQLRFVTLGSVDDGKSTLIGRLLHDSQNLCNDVASRIRTNSGEYDFSLVTDGLLAEREQKITIDVAYRYFRTDSRAFIFADSPGHEQYTRNMVTAASTADVALLLLDVTKGVTPQTRRHACIASLLGIHRIVVIINKMDLVEFQQREFEQRRFEFLQVAEMLQFVEVHAIPVSALLGDNVVSESAYMPWYEGAPLLSYLEDLYPGGRYNQFDFRFPVQGVIRPNQEYRGFSGQVVSGRVHVGDEVVILPSGATSRIQSIDIGLVGGVHEVVEARVPQSVTIRLQDDRDVSRGDVIVRKGNVPRTQKTLEAMCVWFDEESLTIQKPYLILHNGMYIRAQIPAIRYRIDIGKFSREEVSTLELNDIGRVQVECLTPIVCDPYQQNRTTGSFVIVDPATFRTVAA